MAENLRFNLDVDNTAAVGAINDFFRTFEQGAAQAKSKLNSAFNQGVQTEIKIEFKNGELVAKQVQSIKQESSRLADIQKAVNGEVAKTPKALRDQLTILKGLRDNTERFKSGTGQVTKEWEQLTSKIRQAQQSLNTITKGNVFEQLGSAVTGLAGRFTLVQVAAAAAINVFNSVTNAAGDFLKTGAELQVLGLQLEAFTGSAEAADAAFLKFQQVAAATKFNVEEVAKAGQILLAYGIDTATAIEATENLSIAASATGGDVGLLARNLGQAASQGRAYTRDLIQFAIQGIPIWDELAIVTGKSTAELKELAKDGKIGFTEVNAAIRNLTKEGSAFREVADRIQETFIGQLRKIESGVQSLAKEFVETASAVDRAFGAPVAKLLGGFGDLLATLANNWEAITSVIVGATVATAAYIAVSKFGAILEVIQGLIKAYNTWRAGISATAIAQAVLQGLLGNWVAIGAALAAGTAVAIGLNSALKDQTVAAVEATQSARGLADATDELSDAEVRLAAQSGETGRALKAQYQEALRAADEAKLKVDEEIEKAKELKKEVTARYKEEIEAVREKGQVIKDQITKEKEDLDALKEKIKTRYDAEKEQLDEKLRKIREIADEEVARLEELTPAEAALKQLRKEELIARASNLELSEKERLEAQASLERMERQEQIQQIRNKQKEDEKKIQEQITEAEKTYEKAIKSAETAAESRIAKLKEGFKENEAQIRALEEELQGVTKEIDEAIKVTERQQIALSKIPEEVRKQTTAIYDAKAGYDAAKSSVDQLASSLSKAAAEARSLAAARQAAYSGSYTPGSQRASGGPVAGGRTYTVNELGKEAFLSASGRLSMINAPSWGQWKAPGSGTVIPAHLTSQLNIPSGGVNLNSAPAMSGARAGGGMASMVRAMAKALQGGDHIQNNVTIQAANTTQAASDMLVSLTRIKRRRYS